MCHGLTFWSPLAGLMALVGGLTVLLCRGGGRGSRITDLPITAFIVPIVWDHPAPQQGLEGDRPDPSRRRVDRHHRRRARRARPVKPNGQKMRWHWSLPETKTGATSDAPEDDAPEDDDSLGGMF